MENYAAGKRQGTGKVVKVSEWGAAGGGFSTHLLFSLPQAFPEEGSRKGSQILSITATRLSMNPRGAAILRLGFILPCSLLGFKARAIQLSMASLVACK